MFDSDTYSGRPHPLSRVLVPEALVAAWVPFARSRALRLLVASALRLRDHELAARVRPRGRAGARTGAASPWVADVRDAWTFEPLRPRVPDRRSSAASTRGSSAAGSARPTPSSASAARRPTTCAARGSPSPLLVPNGWDPDVGAGRPAEPDEPARPASGSRSSTPAASAATAATRARWSSALSELARDRSRRGRALELVIAGPLTDAEAELFATDVSPARIVVAGSLRATAPWRSSARPTRCSWSPSRPAPSCSTSSCSSTWRAVLRSSPSPPEPRRAGSPARSEPRRSPPTTRRRSRRRSPGSPRASSRAPARRRHRVHLPGPRRGHGGARRGSDRRPPPLDPDR